MVCVIMVTHNNDSTIEHALKSLLNSYYVDLVIVVDNASKDNTKYILRQFIHMNVNVKAVFLKDNVGFPKAVNIGLRFCPYEEYFALFNPDAYATKSWLLKLVNVANSDKSIAMAQSLLIKPNGEIDSAGGFINGLGYPIEFKPKVDLDKLIKINPYEVMYAKGAAVLIRRKAYDEVGGFDDKIFFYYDEADLSYRLRQHGYKIVIVPDSIVYHVGLGSKIPNKELFVLYYIERNHLYFLAKNMPSRLISALSWSIMGMVKERYAIRRRVRFKALLDFIKLITGCKVNEPFKLDSLEKLINLRHYWSCD